MWMYLTQPKMAMRHYYMDIALDTTNDEILIVNSDNYSITVCSRTANGYVPPLAHHRWGFHRAEHPCRHRYVQISIGRNT